ncbi:MAG TPA: acyltransferase domain-containing protein [Caulobacteraceae bacterium]
MTREPPSKLAFIYGARETIWPGIVQTLLAEGGAVRAKLLECDAVVRAKLGWSLEQAFDPHQGSREHVLEPVLTSVQIALTEGWRELGVVPDVIGARCAGEFAAAHVAGRLSLDEALELACRASRVILEGGIGGHMFWLQMAAPEVDDLLQASQAPFTIAADNVDQTTIIACGNGELDAVEAFLTSRRRAFHRLGLKLAFHNAALDRWEPTFCGPFGTRRAGASDPPFYSATVRGLSDDAAHDGRHFWRVIREPALVRPMTRAMLLDGCRTFLEIGGTPSLDGLIAEEAEGAACEVRVLASMRRGKSFAGASAEARTVLVQLGRCGPPAPERLTPHA